MIYSVRRFSKLEKFGKKVENALKDDEIPSEGVGLFDMMKTASKPKSVYKGTKYIKANGTVDRKKTMAQRFITDMYWG